MDWILNGSVIRSAPLAISKLKQLAEARTSNQIVQSSGVLWSPPHHQSLAGIARSKHNCSQFCPFFLSQVIFCFLFLCWKFCSNASNMVISSSKQVYLYHLVLVNFETPQSWPKISLIAAYFFRILIVFHNSFMNLSLIFHECTIIISFIFHSYYNDLYEYS